MLHSTDQRPTGPEPTPALALQRALQSWDLLQELPVALYVCDASGALVKFNRCAEELWGRSPRLRDPGTLFCGSYAAFRPTGEPLARGELPMAEGLHAGTSIRDRVVIIGRSDGTRRAVLTSIDPVLDDDGIVVGAIGCLQDVSARQAAETRQSALLEELSHRVKNTLAIVQALAAQTAPRDDAGDASHHALQGRILALGRAYDHLSSQGWETASIKSLAADILSRYQGRGPVAIRMIGEDVWLLPNAGIAVAIVLHELAENAVRHGALSHPCGSVTLAWHKSPAADRLYIEWREEGGPPVAPPQRQGFGTRFIERAAARQLHGKAAVHFDPEGVRCELEIPLLRPGRAQPARRSHALAHR